MKRNIKTFNRYFTCILYADDKNFDKYFDFIIKNYLNITYILHNRDLTEDGTLKKAHYHFVFKVGENARSVKSISEEINLPIQYIEGCNHDSMLLYLLHINQPNKTQYNVNEILGDRTRLLQLLEKQKDNNLRYKELLDFVVNNRITDFSILLDYCCLNNKVDLLLRSQFLFNEILKKNKFIIDKLK